MPVQDGSGLSLQRLLTLVAEGYTAPRESMAHVLRMHPDERARLLMVGIGIAVSLLGVALLGDRPADAVEGIEDGASTGPVAGYALTVIAAILQYYFFAWLVGLVCSAMGGTGTAEQSRTVVAWWELVTAPLRVVITLALFASSPVAAFMLLAAAILSFVIMAAYIAETHGFTSTARVCGVMLAMLLLISFILSSFLPAFAPVA